MKSSLAIVLLTVLLLSSCQVWVGDQARGLSPEEQKGVRSVYVQDSKAGAGYSIYRVDESELPVWCSVKEAHTDMLKRFNSRFMKRRGLSTPTFFVCYSGDRPGVSSQELEAYNGVVSGVKPQRTPFVEQEFSPFHRLYLAGIVLSGRGEDLLPSFFDLYRSLCTGSDIGCCMFNDGEDLVFNMVIEHSAGLSGLTSAIGSVRDVLGQAQKDLNASFNLFNSTLTDRCSYERWYRSSIYMGVPSPERFLEKDSWKKYFSPGGSGRMSIRGIGVGIIDSTRLSSGEVEDLKNELARLAD